MDPFRRGAIMRGAQILAGGAAALSGMGRGRAASDVATPSIQGSLNTQSNYALGKLSGYAGEVAEDPNWRRNKLESEARYRAAAPLREKLESLYGHGDRRTLIHCTGLHHQTTDLPTLRSTSPWWRDHVAMDRQKKLRSAAKVLEEEIQRVMGDPLEKLDGMFRDAVSSFLAEMNKP